MQIRIGFFCAWSRSRAKTEEASRFYESSERHKDPNYVRLIHQIHKDPKHKYDTNWLKNEFYEQKKKRSNIDF